MDICEGLTPAQRRGLSISAKGVCSVGTDTVELKEAIRRERECEGLLGPDLITLARASFPDLSLSEYVDEVYGGIEGLRRERDERLRLSREREGKADRRRIALELADQLGVDRKLVELELDREEGA